MVGTAIEKMFLSQLDPATAVADGQTIAAATTVFEKRNGQWLMVHHHGSRTPQ
jgi:hypothetical protein